MPFTIHTHSRTCVVGSHNRTKFCSCCEERGQGCPSFFFSFFLLIIVSFTSLLCPFWGKFRGPRCLLFAAALPPYPSNHLPMARTGHLKHRDPSRSNSLITTPCKPCKPWQKPYSHSGQPPLIPSLAAWRAACVSYLPTYLTGRLAGKK